MYSMGSEMHAVAYCHRSSFVGDISQREKAAAASTPRSALLRRSA